MEHGILEARARVEQVGTDGVGACGGASDGPAWTDMTSDVGGLTNATSGADIGSDFNLSLLSLGETDAAAGTTLSTFQSQLTQVACQMQNLTGRSPSNLGFFIDVLGSTSNYQSATDATWEAIRQAQITSGFPLALNEYPNWQGNGVACAGGAEQSPHWLSGSGGCANYYNGVGYYQALAMAGWFGISGYTGGGLGPAIAIATKTDTTHVTIHRPRSLTRRSCAMLPVPGRRRVAQRASVGSRSVSTGAARLVSAREAPSRP